MAGQNDLASVESLRRALEAHGFLVVPRCLFEVGPIQIDAGERRVRRDGAPVHLTPKEFALLLALARAGGRVVSKAALMRHIWGYADAVVSRTVDTHIGELRRKLERYPSSPEYILTVRSVGYRVAGGS